MRVIIAGGRNFSNYPLLKKKCDKILKNQKNIVILSGKARGADTLREYYAAEKKHKVDEYPANWNVHGKSAGYIRNKEMAENADALIAFWDGESRGTMHMINIAKEKGLLVRVINYG